MRRHRAQIPEIQELVEEVILTFRQLRVAAAEIHGDGAPMPGQRGVLVDLARGGPQTVAGMARARGVSRQHVQVLVDRFRSQGLVEFVENPAHRRSPLIRLTPHGRRRVEAMRRRESAAFRALNLDFSPAQIERVSELLRSLRLRLRDFASARRRGITPMRGARRK